MTLTRISNDVLVHDDGATVTIWSTLGSTSPLILTQQAGVASAIVVDGTQHLVVYALDLQIDGSLSLPGKNVTLFARDVTGTSGATISAKGVAGADRNAPPLPPPAPGGPGGAATWLPGPPPPYGQPWSGYSGSPGGDGACATVSGGNGNAGGAIRCFVNTIPGITLDVSGGAGGCGATGQDGATGGTGESATTPPERPPPSARTPDGEATEGRAATGGPAAREGAAGAARSCT